MSPLLERSRKVKLGADTPGDSKADRSTKGFFMGFYSDLMGFYWDLMGFYNDLMGFYSDLMGFDSDSMGY